MPVLSNENKGTNGLQSSVKIGENKIMLSV